MASGSGTRASSSPVLPSRRPLCAVVRLRALSAAEQSILSATELARLGTFTHELRARQYAVGRLLMRQVLGERLGLDPAAVPLRNTDKGPALENWCLSLSHNVEWVAAVFSPRPVGVDIESDRPSVEALRRFCAPGELVRLDPEHYTAVWTRKEALAKAMQRGVGPWLKQWNVRANTSGDWQWETRVVGRAVCSVIGPRGTAVEWQFLD